MFKLFKKKACYIITDFMQFDSNDPSVKLEGEKG